MNDKLRKKEAQWLAYKIYPLEDISGLYPNSNNNCLKREEVIFKKKTDVNKGYILLELNMFQM